MDNNILTCVYCGEEYPAGTPASGADIQVLTDHIRICKKHPLRKAEEAILKLRRALIQIIGSDDKTELERLVLAIRSTIAPEQDKAYVIDAIHALLDTAEWAKE